MGNKASKQGQVPVVAQFNPTYEVIRPIDDPNYGKVKLVRDTKSNRQMILKEFVFDTKEKYEEELKFFRARASHEHPNIVHFIGYNSKDSSNLCSTFYKVSVFLEILITDLQSDFKERIRTLHNYNENDVLLVAENISSALAYMQTHNLSHGDIRPLNIFASGEGKAYKLTDPKLEADRNSNALVKAIFQSAHPLLAPELASIVPTGEFAHNANPYQADIFSFGATLLALATMKSSEDLYDYKKGTISQRLLDERLRQIQQNYSGFTYGLIKDMLSTQPNQRPTAAQIQRAVAPYKEDLLNQHELDLQKHVSFGPTTPKNNHVHLQTEQTKRAALPLASLRNKNIEEDSQGAHTDRSNPAGFPRNLGDFDHHYHQQQSARSVGNYNSVDPRNHDASLFKVREPSNTEHLELEQSTRSPDYADDLDRKVQAALKRTQKTYTQVQSITSKAGGSNPQKQFESLDSAPREAGVDPTNAYKSGEQVLSKYGSTYLAYQPSGNLYITIEPPPVDVKNPFRSDIPRRQAAEERIKRSAVPIIPEVNDQFEGTTFTHEYVIPKNGYHIAEMQSQDPASASHRYGEIEREPIMPLPHKGWSPEKQYETGEYSHRSANPAETSSVDPELNEVVAQIIAEQREYELKSSQVGSQKLTESNTPATDSFHYAYQPQPQPEYQPQFSSFQYQNVPVISHDLQRDIHQVSSHSETRPEIFGERIKRSALASATKKYNRPEDLPSHRSLTNDVHATSYNIAGKGHGHENYLSNRNFSPVHSSSRDVIVNEGRNTAQDHSEDFNFHQKYSTAEPQIENSSSFRRTTRTTGYPNYETIPQGNKKPSQETKSIGPYGGTIVYETHGRRPQEYSSNYDHTHHNEPKSVHGYGRGGILEEISSASSKYTATTLGHGRFGEESGDLRRFI